MIFGRLGDFLIIYLFIRSGSPASLTMINVE